MTTPNTAPTGGSEEVIDLDARAAALGDNDNDDDGEDPAVLQAMLAGYKKVSPEQGERAIDTAPNGASGKELLATDDDADDEVPATAASTQTQPPKVEDDPEIPGLGKVSEVRAKLDAADRLQQQMAQVNGHVGHLKSLINQAGKGKAITKDSLKRVSEAFGDDYAESLAQDLNDAGIGGGAVLDDEAIGKIVAAQVQEATKEHERNLERKAVRRAHKDYADHFSGGPKFDQFVAYIGTLPPEKQQALNSDDAGWDSELIIETITGFKDSQKKAATAQAKQQGRVERAALPSRQGSGASVQLLDDPEMAGYRSVQKRRGFQGTRASG